MTTDKFDLFTSKKITIKLLDHVIALLFGLMSALLGQNAAAELFSCPIVADAGFCLELDWKGKSEIGECKISAGDRGNTLPGNVRLNPNDADSKSALQDIFEDLDEALSQVQ
jgi:hypothetical protein